MKKRKSTGTSGKKGNTFVKSILWGAGIGIIVWLLLLVGVSALISGMAEPEKFVTAVAFVLIAVSSFVSGITSGKMSGIKNVLPGLASGAVMLFVVWMMSLAVSNGKSDMSILLKLIIAFNFLFFAMFGAFVVKPSGKIKRRTGR